MNWTSVKDEMPPMPSYAQDAATESVWVYTDYEYASRYGIGFYDYDGGHWFVQGCQGKVTHWAALEPPALRPFSGQK
jgi:hypothetical protein